MNETDNAAVENAAAMPAAEKQAGAESEAGTILGAPAQTGQASAPSDTQYDFLAIVPEGQVYDAQAASEFSNIARACNLTQEQASQIAAYGMRYMQGGVNAAMQARDAEVTQWGEDAKRQLGAEFQQTCAKAAVGIDRLGQVVPGFRQMLNETGAGNRIEMIRFLAAFGDMVGEDAGHGVAGYGGEKTLYPNTDFGLYR